MSAARILLHRLELAARRPWPQAASRLVLVTGQSDFACSALSPAQRDFLEALGRPDVLLSGFPFDHETTATAPPLRLLAASAANARQYVWSHLSPSYCDAAGRLFANLLAATHGPVRVITGSCGVATARAALARLPASLARKANLLAFGPAGRAPETCASFHAVRGRADHWSAALYRGPPAQLIDGGHLDYWTSPQALRIARAWAGQGAPVAA